MGRVVFSDGRIANPIRAALNGQGTTVRHTVAAACLPTDAQVTHEDTSFQSELLERIHLRSHNATPVTSDLTEIQRLENEYQPPLYAKREIALVRGEGPYLFDSDGRRYLDAMSNYGWRSSVTPTGSTPRR